jgi:hypothetical protein
MSPFKRRTDLTEEEMLNYLTIMSPKIGTVFDAYLTTKSKETFEKEFRKSMKK